MTPEGGSLFTLAPSLDAPSGVPFGRFLLLHRLNMGGMAEVHLAKTAGIHGVERVLAMKRILPGSALDPEFVRMFIDEAKLSVQLNHANIAQTYELGRIGNTFFIAMEYVPGVDLRRVWEHMTLGGAVIPLAAILFIIAKLCEGLDYAHRKTDEQGRPLGIVHRDISPQNVMVAFDGQVKIIDFGIAKAKIRVSRTRVGILKGKFAYMSPEQVSGIELDGRSDVFSLGTIFYELLTKKRLFKSESDFATLEKVKYCEIYPPRLVNPSVPREVEAILLQTLRRERERRTPSAEALHQLVMRFAVTHGETCSARDIEGLLHREFAAELNAERERMQTVMALPVGALPASDDAEVSVDAGFVEETFAELPGVFASDAKTRPARGLPAADEGSRLHLDPTSLGPAVLGEEETRTLDGESFEALAREGASGPEPLAPDEPRATDKPGLPRAPVADDEEPSRAVADEGFTRARRDKAIIAGAGVISVLLVAAAFYFSGRAGGDLRAHVTLDVEPASASVSANARPVTRDFDVDPGDLEITVEAEGYCSWTRLITLGERANFYRKIVLEKKGARGCQGGVNLPP